MALASEYYKSAKEYQVLQVQHAALEKNYNAMKERYDIGVTTAMEYNKAILDYNVAEANVINAKYTLMYNGEVIISCWNFCEPCLVNGLDATTFF